MYSNKKRRHSRRVDFSPLSRTAHRADLSLPIITQGFNPGTSVSPCTATKKATKSPCGLQSAYTNRRSAPDHFLHHKGGTAAAWTSVHFQEQPIGLTYPSQ